MTIFISIASYCDELLFFTINDCFSKAKHSKNLRFGVVDQNSESQKDKIEKLDFANQIKYVYVNKLETFGVSWARNIVFSLWDNETYLLQIDSHTLFEENWDELLIEQHTHLLKISKKPIITTYPYGFKFDENLNPTFKRPSGTHVLTLEPHPDALLEEDNAVLRFTAVHLKSAVAINGYHIAAGFIFTHASFIEEVPYDPYLYFHGEEQSLNIRAYTRFWEVYHPTWIPLYHHYKTKGEDYITHHWHKSVEKKRSLNYAYLKNRSKERINRLFYGDGMKNSIYGLGTKRTLDDFIKFSGIDYKNKTINISPK